MRRVERDVTGAAAKESRKVLMITPHFPPDSNAGTHRVRLLAPYLAGYGWTPTVLTVDPSFYEGSLDQGLSSLVPDDLRVERARAIHPGLTRLAGFGDLGLRSFQGLHAAAVDILTAEPHDLIYITVYPTYTALLGSLLKRRFQIPFVLDYQDPWVGAWGNVVGGGENGAVDLKSRISRRIAMSLEPFAVRAADAITAVSKKTADDVLERVKPARKIPVVEIPIGGDERDFELVRASNTRNDLFDPNDGLFHLVCVGTILPLGLDTLRAFLASVQKLRDADPAGYARLRVHFVGTSNQRKIDCEERVMPIARELGVTDVVSEHPARVDYSDSVNVQVQASAIVLLGSTEHHYTASRIYPALLARRPILAVYHKMSSVSKFLSSDGLEHVHFVQFGDEGPLSSSVAEITAGLSSLLDGPVAARPIDAAVNEELLAPHLAGTLASLFDRVAAHTASGN
jgi:hypothetical protein